MRCFFCFAMLLICQATSCDKFGAKDYEMLLRTYLQDGEDSALVVLQKNHCSDSIAWRLSRELVEYKTNPVDVFRIILRSNYRGDSCDGGYGSIPVSFLQLSPNDSVFESFKQMYTIVAKSNCNKEQVDLLRLCLDIAWGNTVEKKGNAHLPRPTSH